MRAARARRCAAGRSTSTCTTPTTRTSPSRTTSPTSQLDRAFDELADFECEFDVDDFHLYVHDDEPGWQPTRDFPLQGCRGRADGLAQGAGRGPHRRAYARRRPLVDHLVRMQEHYGAVKAGQQAGAVTYFGFLSFFPILALAFFVVGCVAKVYPDARDDLDRRPERRDPGPDRRRRRTRSRSTDIQDAAATVGIIGVVGAALLRPRLALGAARRADRGLRAARAGAAELRDGQAPRPGHPGPHRGDPARRGRRRRAGRRLLRATCSTGSGSTPSSGWLVTLLTDRRSASAPTCCCSSRCSGCSPQPQHAAPLAAGRARSSARSASRSSSSSPALLIEPDPGQPGLPGVRHRADPAGLDQLLLPGGPLRRRVRPHLAGGARRAAGAGGAAVQGPPSPPARRRGSEVGAPLGGAVRRRGRHHARRRGRGAPAHPTELGNRSGPERVNPGQERPRRGSMLAGRPRGWTRMSRRRRQRGSRRSERGPRARRRCGAAPAPGARRPPPPRRPWAWPVWARWPLRRPSPARRRRVRRPRDPAEQPVGRRGRRRHALLHRRRRRARPRAVEVRRHGGRHRAGGRHRHESDVLRAARRSPDRGRRHGVLRPRRRHARPGAVEVRRHRGGTVLVKDIGEDDGYYSGPERARRGRATRCSSPPTTAGTAASCGSPTGPRPAPSWSRTSATTTTTTAVPTTSPPSGDTLFFTADDGDHGRELWKSDGTAAGTVLVKDVYPGGYDSSRHRPGRGRRDGCSSPRATASTAASCGGSDGTAAGTALVEDINPGASDGQPTSRPPSRRRHRCSSPPTTAPTAASCGRPTAPRPAPSWSTDIGDEDDYYGGPSSLVAARRDAVLHRRRRRARPGAVDVRRHRGRHRPGRGHPSRQLRQRARRTSPPSATRCSSPPATACTARSCGRPTAPRPAPSWSRTSTTTPATTAARSSLDRRSAGCCSSAPTTATHGRELWTSDGTEAGTSLVEDINVHFGFDVAERGRPDRRHGTLAGPRVRPTRPARLAVRPVAGSKLKRSARDRGRGGPDDDRAAADPGRPAGARADRRAPGPRAVHVHAVRRRGQQRGPQRSR